MNKELEKRIEERARWFIERYELAYEDCEYLAKQTLIWETEARIEEHGDKCGYLFGGCEYCTKLQSELKMLRGL